jgi:hypothetical protein
VALSQIRGISQAIEERLAEEGIEDATSLAMADPLKLFRCTSFDKRQILWWIDEALLINALPNHWSKLQNEGVTGAVDLAWMADLVENNDYKEQPVKLSERPEVVKLSGQVGIDPLSLANTTLRLFQDSQVLLVWALYQYGDSYLDQEESEIAAHDTKKRETKTKLQAVTEQVG